MIDDVGDDLPRRDGGKRVVYVPATDAPEDGSAEAASSWTFRRSFSRVEARL
jgi:hypothetical protein